MAKKENMTFDLLNQLAAFGVVFDEGFCGEGNPEKGIYGPYRQSDREMIYRTVIKEMVKKNPEKIALIFEDKKDGVHETLQNFTTIRGAQNKQYRDTLGKIRHILKKATFYIAELEPIDNATMN